MLEYSRKFEILRADCIEVCVRILFENIEDYSFSVISYNNQNNSLLTLV